MSNWNKDSVLKFLCQQAYNAPVGQCMSLATDLDNLKTSEFYYKQMLAVLSQFFLTTNGEILPEYQGKRPAIQKALDAVQYCHSWTVCGPVRDGMERMLCELEGKEYTEPQ